jgi:ubiquitin carboxyl-terminal hydrolase 5/13
MSRVPPDAATLDAVRSGMRGLAPPGHYDRVYKDECMFSFDTPESPGGLFVNLKTYQVGGRRVFTWRVWCVLQLLRQLVA